MASLDGKLGGAQNLHISVSVVNDLMGKCCWYTRMEVEGVFPDGRITIYKTLPEQDKCL